MLQIEIRKVNLTDVVQLQKIARQTFFETFSDLNTEENMTKYLNENLSIENLSVELKNENSEQFFAVLDGKLIGYLKLNFGQSQTELKDEKALEMKGFMS